MENNQVKRAIDTNLSCLRVTERDTMVIMNRVKEGNKVKKKLSVAFALVMVLLLLAVTAFAISALSGLIFLDRQDSGTPISCVVAGDTVYFTTNLGLHSWVPTNGEPTILVKQSELRNNAISIDSQLYYNGTLMLLDQAEAKIWSYQDGALSIALNYAGTALDNLDLLFEDIVYQDTFLFLRAIPIAGFEEDALLYRVNPSNGGVETIEVKNIIEIESYQEGEILAIQRQEDDRDVVITIDTQTKSVKKEVVSLPILGIEGITYSSKTDAVYAMVGGSLSVWNDPDWLPMRQYSIPERCFYFGIINNGYVAASIDGVQYIAFEGEDNGLNLSIRGFMPANNNDHDYELTHPGLTITRQLESHFCGEEIRQAIQSGDTTDLFLINLDANVLALMENGTLEALSSSSDLTEDSLSMISTISDAISRQGVLYAVPSDVMVMGWSQNSDTERKTPSTINELLQGQTAWSKMEEDQKISHWIAYQGATVGWTENDYAGYLLKQHIMECNRASVLPDFSSIDFINALQLMKDTPFVESAGEGSIFSSNHILSLRGLREDESADGTTIMPPTVSAESHPLIPVRIHAYVLNPNSQNKAEAIAYLEYIASNRNAETHTLLKPNSAQSALYPHIEEWIKDIIDEQHSYDAANGEATDEEALASRVADIKTRPDSWEVTEDALNEYRQSIAPNIDLMLHPLLADQTGWHNVTYKNMAIAIQEYLQGELNIDQCIERLNGLSSDFVALYEGFLSKEDAAKVAIAILLKVA